jgi:hypothetical protein
LASQINASNSGFGGIVSTGDSSGVLQLQTTGTTAVTIDTSQNVGIGESSPDTKVHIYGAATAGRGQLYIQGSSTVSRFTLANSSDAYALNTYGDSSTSLLTWDTNSGYSFRWTTSDAERMRIDSSGKVGIGTASPTETLSLMTASGTTSIRLSTNNNQNANVSLGNTATNFTIGTNFGTTGTKITMNLQCPDNSLSIDGEGYLIVPKAYAATTGSAANVHILSSGVFIRSTSSIKYKTDVQNAVHGLDKVMELRPVTYKGINDGDIVFGGLIAEEVHDAGLTEFVQYAEDGTPDALAYGNMVSLLTKAIQEQQTIINDLKARVTVLEAK